MAKRTITITSQVEVDVDFPLYVRLNPYSVVKFFSEATDGIYVSYYNPGWFKIQAKASMPSHWMNSDIITQEEFELEFKKVQEKINQLI